MQKNPKTQPLIGIIGGKGAMGSLFVDFFKERGVKVLISDKNTKISNIELAKKADIIIVSVPIDHTKKVIDEILPHAKKTTALMDFTSVKQMPVNAMLKGNCEVLGMHPMFGSTNPIPGQTVILTPTKKSGKWSKWIESFLQENDVKTIKLTTKKHDQIMGIAQGLIHCADITFSDALRRTKIDPKTLLSYASKASELKVQLAARLIAQSPNLYGNIQISNPSDLKYIKLLQKSVEEMVKIVEKKDLKAFEKYFNKSKKYFGKYLEASLDESSYLIDKLIEKQRHTKAQPQKKPGKNSIALLGPKNTFSDMACSKYLTNSASKLEKYYCKTIPEIFELTEKGTVEQGFIPIENKVEGSVRESMDGLFQKKVHIVSAISLPIHHQLISLPHTKQRQIKKIISHPQALAQCSKFLQKHFPKAEQIAYPSTSAAIETLILTQKSDTAVIASQEAALAHSLKTLYKNIEDEKDNSTTFFLINQGQNPPRDGFSSKTSIAFHFSKDTAGSLFQVFEIFARAKINLTKIESRPTKKQFGDYIFYLDFEGNLADPKVSKTLKTLEQKVARLKILGTY